jgi:oligopeptidase B
MQRLLTRRRVTQALAAASLVPLAAPWNHAVDATAMAAPERPAAPIAPVVPKTFEAFGQKRLDNYDWLRDRDDPRVTSYLQAENAYADARLTAIRPLVDEIAAELKARAAEKDASVPALNNGYVYERRYAHGALYPLIVRRKDVSGTNETDDNKEEIVLDVGALAAGHAQYRLGDWTVSPDNTRVAFAVDFIGDLEFHVFVRDIATGEVIDQGIGDASADLVFAADSSTLFYVRNEPETVRSYQVWRHRVGSDAATDVLVYQERDPAFSVSLDLSKSRKFILLAIDEERTSELRYLPADRPAGEFTIMEPRRFGIRYDVDHVGETFFIRTNLDAPDFRLMSAPQATPGVAHWSELLPETPGHYFGHLEAFDGFLAMDIQDEHGTALRVFRLPDLHESVVPRPAEIGVASSHFSDDNDINAEPSVTVLRLRFSSLLRPQCIYDFDVTTGALTLRKEDPASRWFDPSRYALDRISATAADGERVPVTIVYRKDLRVSAGNPTLVAGYGAYGYSFRPTFEADTVSLLDHGFVYAIAHVRGGRERGERWYVEGRMLMKRNTFTDFITATETLIAKGYADPGAVFAQGRSAGGLLMGAVANLRPDLYAGIVAEVPFVDVVTTMSDASVPLTTLEYDEWGNPAVQREYEYMVSYSPYDNVAQKRYPAMFVTAGFNDSQVSYAEPAKWVALLRAQKTDARDLIFKTDMGAGHGGRSGRLGSIVETAEIMGWLVAQARDGRLP